MTTVSSGTLERAVDGDEEALGALLKGHAAQARRAISGKIPRRWRSVLSDDDVMQQTYADAIRDLHSFKGRDEATFGGWLARLARCNLEDAIRALEAVKRGGHRNRIQPSQDGEAYRTLATLLFANGKTASGCYAEAELRSALDSAIDALPTAYRVVVCMYDLNSQPVDHVANRLNRSVGAVYMLRARAHERLRDILGGSGKFFASSR